MEIKKMTYTEINDSLKKITNNLDKMVETLEEMKKIFLENTDEFEEEFNKAIAEMDEDDLDETIEYYSERDLFYKLTEL